MFIWYALFIILGVVFIISNKYSFWDNLVIGVLIWVPFIIAGLLSSIWASGSQTEIVETNTYTLCDFSDYYAAYEKDTYLVIQDNGEMLVRFVNKDKEMTEEPHSYYSINYVDEEIEPFITVTLKDTKNKILKHLFWNFNPYEYKITAPIGTEIVYKR